MTGIEQNVKKPQQTTPMANKQPHESFQMTTPQPMFRKDASVPGGYLVSMPGALLLAADAAYDRSGDTPPEGKARARLVVSRILSAATKAGFTKSELLETMLCNGEISHRVKAMACEAIDAIGAHEAARIIEAAMNEGD